MDMSLQRIILSLVNNIFMLFSQELPIYYIFRLFVSKVIVNNISRDFKPVSNKLDKLIFKLEL